MHKTRILLWIAAVVFALSIDARATTLRDSLAMFETGATQPNRCAADRKRGASGEVSRYQIMPAVWRAYSKSRNYENPEVAWTVAKRILDERIATFSRKTGRKPDGVDVYLLWNKPGHFQAVKFQKSRVKPLYRKRAERFASLWQAVILAGSDGRRQSGASGAQFDSGG